MNKKTVKENQLLLSTGNIITFNKEQHEGVNKIRAWLKNGPSFFTLSGFAGTGKTTIIKKILDSYHRGVVVSAPTHKAKKVISKTTNKTGQTLHGLLGLRPDISLDDFNPNDPTFNPIAIPRITDYNFVIIDEASMINKDLFELVKKKIKGSRTKVLFMGDPAQIPPVGEKESFVFNYEGGIKHHLTKIERQNLSNPLTHIYTNIRNNLLFSDNGFKRISYINEDGEGVRFFVNKKEFRKEVFEKFSSVKFKNDIDFCKLIMWRNNTVMLSNQIIRKSLFEKTDTLINVGDILMGYRSIVSPNLQYNIIENSADYRVVDVSGLEKNNYGIYGYSTTLREYQLNGKHKDTDIFIVDTKNKKNIFLYAENHDTLREIAKKNKKRWKDYYWFRGNNVLMTTVDRYANKLYRKSSDIIVKDLDYGYAITGHKSQGSTYTHVFIMEDDINLNPLIKERNQIKYVALTRPTTSATVLTTKIDE